MSIAGVFRLRTLQGRCDLGIGLTWDEIVELSALEHQFAPGEHDQRRATGRRYRRDAIQLVGFLHGDRIHDRVQVIELSPGGVVVRGAPIITRGEPVELAIESSGWSYHFAAEGVWQRDDQQDFRVGLAFRGVPVGLRRSALGARDELGALIDEIAAAA